MSGLDYQDLLKKAWQSLRAAEKLFNDNFYDFSASRSYYSMFYAVEALLASKGLNFSKHSAVISSFGKEFIKTGLFPVEFHKYFIEAFDARQIGDYGTFDAVDSDTAKRILDNAGIIIKKIEDYLS